MDKLIINGPNKLTGEIAISGSKNCALPVLFATLLTEKENIISNVPNLRDMDSTKKMLLHFGSKIQENHDSYFGSKWKVHSTSLVSEAPYDLVRKMRASFLSLGPLLARLGVARVSRPGGCAIGARPINYHLSAFKDLGANIEEAAGYVEASAKKLIGNKICFPFASVGATENAIMAATLARGETCIENAAKEPEIIGLCNALRTMGAEISGDGTSKILIQGKDNLGGMDFKIPPDRIETATYLIATQMCGGKVKLKNTDSDHVSIIIDNLKKTGAKVTTTDSEIEVESSSEINAVDIKTSIYPGFPTDVQAQWMSLMCLSNGVATIEESIFENRFMHVPELKRLGADLNVSGSLVQVKGKGRESLKGAPVMATDLRASASLVLAGLVSSGETEIKRIYHLDRGYESMEVKLRALGASVERDVE